MSIKKVLQKLKIAKSENPRLQEYFFREALAEVGITSGEISIDHRNGKCWHEDVGTVPIIFPIKRIEEIKKLKTDKKIEYFFKGVITPERNWVQTYTGTSTSDYGRNPSKKYSIDYNYYKMLSSAKFGLSPIGDCPWSYRFFETIMCSAIPIIGSHEIDVFSNNFHFLRHGETHQYSIEKCEENIKTFLEQHTLPGIGFNINNKTSQSLKQ